jgi:VIT1/CCC1 family predicted Fe2+/Mn2+ transporter
LGANDGVLSTESLVLGAAAAHGSKSNVLIAGLAGLVAGAMSMAAGEFVSVHAQADTEMRISPGSAGKSKPTTRASTRG